MKTNCVNWGKYKDKDGYGRGFYKGRIILTQSQRAAMKLVGVTA